MKLYNGIDTIVASVWTTYNSNIYTQYIYINTQNRTFIHSSHQHSVCHMENCDGATHLRSIQYATIPVIRYWWHFPYLFLSTIHLQCNAMACQSTRHSALGQCTDHGVCGICFCYHALIAFQQFFLKSFSFSSHPTCTRSRDSLSLSQTLHCISFFFSGLLLHHIYSYVLLWQCQNSNAIAIVNCERKKKELSNVAMHALQHSRMIKRPWKTDT